MSITDLKALTESWLMEARKLPAAPALQVHIDVSKVHSGNRSKHGNIRRAQRWSDGIHYIVDPAEFLDTAVNCIFQTVELAHIDRSDSNDLCTWSHRGNVFGGLFGLFDISADNASIRAQMDQRANLGAADRACAARAEDDFFI